MSNQFPRPPDRPPERSRLITPATATLMGVPGPFMLIGVLALAGVHITWWMIALALFGTIAVLVSAIFQAIAEGKNNNNRSSLVADDAFGGFTTSAAGKRHTPIDPISWRQADPDAQPNVVIDPSIIGQKILGFGAALTGSSCAVLNRMPTNDHLMIMDELFRTDQMNLNVNRLSIGASDYSTDLFSYCDGPADPQLTRFSVDKDRQDVLPVVSEAVALNGDMFLLASPWSPPAWMKPNGTMLGGAMGDKYFDAYAQYFVRYLQAYEKWGISIDAITVQNEVDADQGNTMPSATWSKQLEAEFVKLHLGPALRAAGCKTLIWIIDHNFDLEQRAIDSLSDAELLKWIDGIAWHGYFGSADAVGRVHDAHPHSNHYFTEFNTFYNVPDYHTDWTHWGQVIGEAMRNWCRSYTMWNVALDEHGLPKIGPFDCGGVISIDSQTNEVVRSGGYWGLGHYSKAVRRGALRIDSRGDVADLTHVAFVNPDGGKVLVLSNKGADRTITIDDGDRLANIALEADSVTTLIWR
ncbi:MAG TPA: glycoside hydrolase family 30 beta sandwich domain-containing protein [Candidatus Obscuribacterales bacterium]